MNKTLAVTLIAVLCSVVLMPAAQAQAQDSHVQLTLRGWFSTTNVKSDIVKELFGEPADAIKKMNLGDEIAAEGWLRWQIVPRHALELRYLWLAKSDHFTVRHPVVFDSETTLFGSGVDSKVNLSYGRLGWHWAIFKPENGHFLLETIVDASAAQAKVSDKHTRLIWPYAPGNKDSSSVTGIWPTVGLAATISPVRWIDFFGEVSGMTYVTNVDVLDWEAGIRVNPFDFLGIEAGYRSLMINGSDNGHDARFTFSGPFCGTKLRF